MYFDKKSCYQKHFIKNYVLDHSGLTCISENVKKNPIVWRCPQKNRFCHTGGGAKNVTDMSATYRFFLRLP